MEQFAVSKRLFFLLGTSFPRLINAFEAFMYQGRAFPDSLPRIRIFALSKIRILGRDRVVSADTFSGPSEINGFALSWGPFTVHGVDFGIYTTFFTNRFAPMQFPMAEDFTSTVNCGIFNILSATLLRETIPVRETIPTSMRLWGGLLNSPGAVES